MATEPVTSQTVQAEVVGPPTASAALVPRPAVSFDADDPVSLYMNTGIFDQLQRVAKMMAKANLVPAHLRGDEKIADCFLVAAQAFRWRMDPFSVAQHTFVTSGKLGYEGKLIAGLINASGRLKSNLKPIYSGPAGLERKVTIVGHILGEAEERVIDGTVSQWQTANEKWKTMPDQMLFYRGAREWARRHMPEVMLGISAEEEIVEAERVPVGLMAPRSLDELAEKLKAEAPAPAADPAPTEPCKHPTCPPSRIAALVPGQTLVCPCGEEWTAEPAPRKPKQTRLEE